VLALVREGFVVERLEEDLDLLLEQFAVGILVDDRRAEGLDFAGVIAAADTEHGGRQTAVAGGATPRTPHVPVIVRLTADSGGLEIALVKNLQPEDLLPLEDAKA
jgi:hypothetical protein